MLSLFGLLIVVEPLVALAAAVLLFGGSYVLIFTPPARRLPGSARSVRGERRALQVAQEVIGGIKDVKILGVEDGLPPAVPGPVARMARAARGAA